VYTFSISWARESSYLFSPFCLIGRDLLKIRREAVNRTCLIAPAWSSQIWYPQLLAMLVSLQIVLPSEVNLLLRLLYRCMTVAVIKILMLLLFKHWTTNYRMVCIMPNSSGRRTSLIYPQTLLSVSIE